MGETSEPMRSRFDDLSEKVVHSQKLLLLVIYEILFLTRNKKYLEIVKYE